MNRHGKNPLITPSDVVPSLPGRKVECVFNAGVTEYHGGDYPAASGCRERDK